MTVMGINEGVLNCDKHYLLYYTLGVCHDSLFCLLLFLYIMVLGYLKLRVEDIIFSIIIAYYMSMHIFQDLQHY